MIKNEFNRSVTRRVFRYCHRFDRVLLYLSIIPALILLTSIIILIV